MCVGVPVAEQKLESSAMIPDAAGGGGLDRAADRTVPGRCTCMHISPEVFARSEKKKRR